MKMDVMTQMMKDPEMLAVFLKKGRTEKEQSAIGGRLTSILIEKGLIPAGRAAASVGRRALPAIIREGAEENNQQRLQSINDQQGAVAPAPRPPVPRPSLVAPPTNQALAVPSPSPAPAPASSGPVDRTRYAALFPNDMASSMINQNRGPQTFARGGIASLMRGR